MIAVGKVAVLYVLYSMCPLLEVYLISSEWVRSYEIIKTNSILVWLRRTLHFLYQASNSTYGYSRN